MRDVRDGPATDGHPINMKGVRRTDYMGVPREMKIVELTVGKTNVKPMVKNGGVHTHAGGAQILRVAVVVGVVLHPCHDPHLPG